MIAELARRKVKKEVKKERTVSVQVDVFVKNGEIDEVKQSAHLGNQPMVYDKEKDEYIAHGTGYSKTLRNAFFFSSFGKIEEREVIVPGMHEVDTPEIDALAFLDEPEKLAALTDEEKEKLSHITILQLRAISIEAHTDDKPGWTPLQAAVIAILQHEGLPEPTKAHNTKMVPGNKAVGCYGCIYFGANGNLMLIADGEYWFGCEYKPCEDGRYLYRFTWMDVPKSYLEG